MTYNFKQNTIMNTIKKKLNTFFKNISIHNVINNFDNLYYYLINFFYQVIEITSRVTRQYITYIYITVTLIIE